MMDNHLLGNILGGMDRTEFENVLKPHLKEMSDRTVSPLVVLTCLYSSGVFDMAEIEDIEAIKVPHRMSEDIYKKVILKNKGAELIEALRKSNQGHIIKIISDELSKQLLAQRQNQENPPQQQVPPQNNEEIRTIGALQLLTLNEPSGEVGAASGIRGEMTSPTPSPQILNKFFEGNQQLDPWKSLMTALEQLGGASPQSKLIEFKRQQELLNISSLVCQDGLFNKNDDYYNIKGSGHALIINNKFDRPLGSSCDPKMRERYASQFRQGSSADEEILRGLCATLKLSMIYEENVSSGKLCSIIEDFHRTCAAKKCGFTIVFFMSHGGSKSDSLLMDDLEEIDLHRDLIQKFGRLNFPYGNEHGGGVDGMPKLFFVNACRDYVVVNKTPLPKPPGGMVPSIINKLKTDSSPCSKQDEFEGSNFSDIFIGQSALPLHVSYRDVDLGSFYIRAIASIFTNYGGDLHLVKMVEKSGDLVKNLCEAFNQQALAANKPEKRVMIQIPEIRIINFNKKFKF